jgi:hypothetical protein
MQMKNLNQTQLDTDQINKRKFDESLDADRVILVGQDLSIDSNKIAEAVKEGLKSIEFNIDPKSQTNVVNSAQIQTIKENVFIPQLEIKTIEVPVIIKEIEYKTIEVPVITEKIVTVENPTIIKEIEFKEIEKERYYPFLMQACAVIQALAVIGLILINLLKK